MFSISAMLFILIFFSGISAAIFFDPSFGVLTYIFDYFVFPQIRWWYPEIPDLRYAYIAALSIIFGYAVRYHRYRFTRSFGVSQTKWLLLQAVLMIMLSLVAIDPIGHEVLVLRYMKYVIIYFLIILVIDNKQKFERLIGMYLLGCTYVGYSGWVIGRDGMGTLGFIGPADAPDGNGTAGIIVAGIPLLLFYIFQGKKWQKAISFIALVFCLNVIILINSRGAFVALVIAGFYLLIQMFRTSRRVKSNLRVKMVTVAVIAVCSFSYLADDFFWNRMATLETTYASGEMGAGRDLLYKAGIKMSLDYPLGTGGGGYEYLSAQYLPEDWITKSKSGSKASHSLWIDALVNNGYLGLIFLLAYVFSTFKLTSKVKRHLRTHEDFRSLSFAIALEASFIAYLCAATFLSVLYCELLYLLPAFLGSFYLIHSTPKEATSAANLQYAS